MQYPEGGAFLAEHGPPRAEVLPGPGHDHPGRRRLPRSEHGRTVLANAAIKLLMQQDSATIEPVVAAFRLSPEERQFLLGAAKGEGLFFARGSHVALGRGEPARAPPGDDRAARARGAGCRRAGRDRRTVPRPAVRAGACDRRQRRRLMSAATAQPLRRGRAQARPSDRRRGARATAWSCARAAAPWSAAAPSTTMAAGPTCTSIRRPRELVLLPLRAGGDVDRLRDAPRAASASPRPASGWAAAVPRPGGAAAIRRRRAGRRGAGIGSRLDEQVVMNTAAAVYHDALWREPRRARLPARARHPRLGDRATARSATPTATRWRRSCAAAPACASPQELGLLRRPDRGDGGRAAARVLRRPHRRARSCAAATASGSSAARLDDDPSAAEVPRPGRRAAGARATSGRPGSREVVPLRGRLRLPHRRRLAAAGLQPLRHPPAGRAARVPRAAPRPSTASSTATRPGARRRRALRRVLLGAALAARSGCRTGCDLNDLGRRPGRAGRVLPPARGCPPRPRSEDGTDGR